MEIKKINGFFRKLGVLQVKYRFPVIGVLVAITAFSMVGLPRVKLDLGEDEWFKDTDVVKVNNDHFKDVFGNDDSVMVLVKSDNVFDPVVMDAILRLGNRLKMEVPYAKEITSIMEMNISKGNEEGFEVVNPFEYGIPSDPDELQEKIDFIMSRNSLVDKLVSSDRTETWVILSLESYDTELAEAQKAVGRAAINIVEGGDFASDRYELYGTGMGYNETHEDATLGREMVIRVSFGFLVMFLCLVIFTRSLRGIVVPVLATIFGISSVFGISGWIGARGSDMMVTLPILLGMALSVGYSVHCINSFRMFFRRSGKRKEAVISSVEECGWPVLFTVITTMAGLVAFAFADIVPIKWTGLISAGVVFFVYAYVIILIPILLSFGKDRDINEFPSEEKTGATKADYLFEKFGTWVLQHAKAVVVVSVLIFGVMIPGLFKISVNMDYIEMMGRKVPYIARLAGILESQLGSQYSYDMVVEFENADEFKNADAMKRLESLESYLGSLKLTSMSNGKPRTQSIVQTVKEMNRAFNEDNESAYVLPDDSDVLTELLFMYEISGGGDLYNWLDEEYRTAHIHVELSGYDANQMVADSRLAIEMGRELFPDADVSLVGEVVQFAAMNSKVVYGELKSFSLSFLMILVFLLIAFASIRTGFIGMIPNIAPVILIGGIMGYFGLSLDMMTMTIMPMILGIAVDDTIHMTNHVKLKVEETGDVKKSILITFREIGKTMGMTTVILCSMFLVYTFSPVGCLMKVGVLSMVGLGSALIADFTLTPALLYITKTFGGNK